MILVQEILRDVVKRVSDNLHIDINYQCGDANYVCKQLDIMSRTAGAESIKYPLFVVYMPIVEDKTDPTCYCKVSLKILIATLSDKGFSYEQRLEYSFKGLLHPIYEEFIKELKKDNRLKQEYADFIPHTYTDNYQYGFYGTKTSDNQVFDTIDGIDITNLKLTVKYERICEKLSHGRKV